MLALTQRLTQRLAQRLTQRFVAVQIGTWIERTPV